jgi:hypothetical protein
MKIRTLELKLNEPYAIPKTSITEFREFQKPKAIPRNTGRTYETRRRTTYAPYVSDLLDRNEFLAYEKKALTNEELQRDILKKFARNTSLRYKFKRYAVTLGMFRKKYNEQKLYAAQPTPYLVSFAYDKFNRIIVGGNDRSYMTFQECYQRCLDFKIADPRFVPPELIVEIRNRQNEGIEEWLHWIVPDDKTLDNIRVLIKRDEIYNSVRFSIGWTREDTPHDYDIEDVE